MALDCLTEFRAQFDDLILIMATENPGAELPDLIVRPALHKLQCNLQCSAANIQGNMEWRIRENTYLNLPEEPFVALPTRPYAAGITPSRSEWRKDPAGNSE